ncbi:MAG: hypothetical protein NZ890_21910 [Myxococcota bacterium]|nr:hypothetical protein [Myxococcota bacterium]
MSVRSLAIPLLLAAAGLVALSPALAAAPLLSARYDWRYFDTMTEIARRSVLWYGQVPLWNPYACGGEVDLANPQSLTAAPTFLLVLLFGTAVGLKLSMCLYYALALDGTYRLARHLGASPTGAGLAALGFGLSGYQALHLAAGHINFAGVCLYPYLLLCYDRSLRAAEWVVPMGMVAAWIMALGGTFTPPMAGVLLLLWAGAAAIRLRSLKPLLMLLLGVVVAVGCGAVRALPVLEFLIDHPRPPFRHRVVDVSLPWQVVGDLFAWRRFAPVPGRQYHGHEYAARLPWLLTPLWAGALLWIRRHAPGRRAPELLALAMLGLLLSMGQFSPLAPWSLLQHLPVFSALRVPSRFEILVVLALALLSAHGWDAVAARLDLRAGRRTAVAALLLLAVAADGALYTAQSFRGVFTVPLRPPAGPQPFYHIEGHWMTMRQDIFAGRGTLGCDEEAPLQRAEALDVGPVPQERLLDPAAGEVISSQWSPNRRVITVDLQRETWLLINSNWNEHFKSHPGRITKVAGRLAVDLSGLGPGRHTITVRYAPRSFYLGAVLSALSLPLALAVFVWMRWLRRRRGQAG